MTRYNEIATRFYSSPHQFLPIFWEGPEAADCASGFLDAVALRPRQWDTLKNHRRDGLLMSPLFILGGHKHHDGRVSDADMKKLSSEMPDIMHNCILGIHHFWKDLQGRS